MYKKIRPLLFKFYPEDIHALTLDALNNTRYLLGAQWFLKRIFRTPPKPVTLFGLTFPNPVGLAAGFDKNAAAIHSLSLLGFGHIEVGTVTPLPQRGNPEPRVFRLREDKALINRMGFPSHGSVRVMKSLKKRGYCRSIPPAPERIINLRRFFPEGPYKRKNKSMILGVNIGKNKNTPNEEAVLDYLSLLENFSPCADYLTINISSPNTEGLRDLQKRNALEKLLKELNYQRKSEEEKLQKKIPLLVKLSPDLTKESLDNALDVILATEMDGIIATNTTLSRPKRLKSQHQAEEGGLSGSPLRLASETTLQHLVKEIGGKIPVISSGGIMSPEDAKRRLDLGAALVQIYTGLVYEGPGFVKKIVNAL